MTVLPMSIRCISLVPSKIVKILALRAFSAGQQPAGPRGISTDSARPAEMNPGFGSARVRFRSWYERTASGPASLVTDLLAHYSGAGTPEVYFRADLPISRRRPSHPSARADSGVDGPHAGRAPGNIGPLPSAVVRPGWHDGPDRPNPANADEPAA